VKLFFDRVVSFLLVLILSPVMLVIAILLKFTSEGTILYWSERIGKNNVLFLMPKFRTMRQHTPVLATHLLTDADDYLTFLGQCLRKMSLDELPQLFSILKGDMSFVGPRPALFNQYDLIELRTKEGVHVLTPGLTGWAQINGRDELTIQEKVACDKYYLCNFSFILDCKIMVQTIPKILKCDNVYR